MRWARYHTSGSSNTAQFYTEQWIHQPARHVFRYYLYGSLGVLVGSTAAAIDESAFTGAVEFCQELREQNSRALLWFLAVCVPGFWLWFAFDYYLSPENWKTFFWWRSGAAIVCAVLAIFGSRPRFRRFTWLATWLFMLTMTVCVAAMLPRVGDAIVYYIPGFSLALIMGASLPIWTPRWSSWFSLVAVGAAIALMARSTMSLSAAPLVMSVFVVLTVFVGANLITWVVHKLRRQDFIRRHQLEAATASATRAMDELSQVNQELQDLSTQRNQMFSNISHELRTPLTLIVAPVDEMLGKLVPGPHRDAMVVVRRNAQRLLRMIDDLLDLAKLEAGGLRLDVVRANIAELARQVADNGRPACEAKGIDLRFTASGPPQEMYGDPHRLEIVLTNLIGNAIKFTPEGGQITVGVEYSSEGAAVSVSDTGPGIPADQLHKIFERFHQVRDSERPQQGGTGIGLALAKELTELHGGNLRVQSVWGRGSTFRVFLPAGDAHFQEQFRERRQVQLREHPGRRAGDRPKAAPTLGEGALPGARDSQRPVGRILLDRGRVPRILLVEDEDDLRGFMYGVLSQHFDVSAAADGAEALEILAKQRPDLVLTDIMLPKVSGIDLCRTVKSDARLQSIPVILLTAHGDSETALEGYDAGADDFVSKPFHVNVLLARVRAHLQVRALSLRIADQARLASAGTLAAGLAHEVKNPVNAILSAATVLEAGGSVKVPSEKLLRIIIDGARRVNDVVSALNTHARPADGTDLQAVNVHDGVESTLRLLEHKTRDIQIHREIEATESVRAPARAFNQVVLNLLDNAIRSGGRNIWIAVGQRGRMVTVAVADDGPGVPPDLVPRLFDAFFTTRSEGDGTGLGLHLSRRIAQECGGELHYENRPGGGAKFVLEVPAIGAETMATDAAQ